MSPNLKTTFLPLVSVYKSASHSSEIVTQLLSGQEFELIDQENGWNKIRTLLDDYEGWILKSQVDSIDPPSENFQRKILCNPVVEFFFNQSVYFFTMGSEFLADEKTFLFSGNQMPLPEKFILRIAELRSPEMLTQTALQYLQAPYLWGGRSIFGIDCSGLTQMIFRQCGFSLMRDAYQQATQGILVEFAESARTGDLAFFENEEKKISHVGMLLSKDSIIHASGKVRIDKFDHFGIYNKAEGKYSHRLRFIRRIF